MEHNYISEIERKWYPATEDGKVVGEYKTATLPYRSEFFQTEELMKLEGEYFCLEFYSWKLKNPRMVFYGTSLAWMEFKIRFEYPKSYSDTKSSYRLIHHKRSFDLFAPANSYEDVIVVSNKTGVDKAVDEKSQSVRIMFRQLQKDNTYQQYFSTPVIRYNAIKTDLFKRFTEALGRDVVELYYIMDNRYVVGLDYSDEAKLFDNSPVAGYDDEDHQPRPERIMYAVVTGMGGVIIPPQRGRFHWHKETGTIRHGFEFYTREGKLIGDDYNYDRVYYDGGHLIIGANEYEGCGLFNGKGKRIVSSENGTIGAACLEETLYCYVIRFDESPSLYFDADGVRILEQFDYVETIENAIYSHGRCCNPNIFAKGGKVGLLKFSYANPNQSEVVLEPVYEDVFFCNMNFHPAYLVRLGGKFGVLILGKGFVLPAIYDEIGQPFMTKAGTYRFPVAENGEYKFIEVVCPREE